MVADVATGDPTRMLCLNCARRVVSPTKVSKYVRLAGYLKFRGDFTDNVRLQFARVDGIIGDNLPMEAYKKEAWWENVPSREHARAWMEAGWEAQEVNLEEGYVVFKKVSQTKPRSHRRKSRTRIEKPFTPVPVPRARPRAPSKTKLSKLYARIKNIERKKMGTPAYPRGSFKPKPKHEKKLYKPDEKPQ